MKTKLPKYFYALPFVIMLVGFAVGQGKEGAGVAVVILLSTILTIYAARYSGKEKANG